MAGCRNALGRRIVSVARQADGHLDELATSRERHGSPSTRLSVDAERRVNWQEARKRSRGDDPAVPIIDLHHTVAHRPVSVSSVDPIRSPAIDLTGYRQIAVTVIIGQALTRDASAGRYRRSNASRTAYGTRSRIHGCSATIEPR